MNAQSILRGKAREFTDKPAIFFRDQPVSFSQLKTEVFKLAAGLKGQGVKKGDKVAVYLPNWPEYIYSYLALFSLAAVVVPLDFMLTEAEVINFINHSDSKFLIAKAKKGVDLKNIKHACPALDKIVFLNEEQDASPEGEGFVDWNKIGADEELAEAQIQDKDFAAIFYTSGSTGHPKGVLLNYGHLDNPVRCISHFLKVTDKDSYLCAGVPFSHVGGLDYLLFMLNFGSTLILLERFHPMEALKNIAKYKPTIFCIVPAMFVAILSLKDCEKFDLTSLRYPVVFGAPSSPDLLNKFHGLCPNATLLNGWGMTETAAPNTYSPPGKINSIGPFGVGIQAKIVDDEGRGLKAGERGELWVKGEAVMAGYYKEEDLTREVITSDGWLKTGDIAEYDQEGLFYIKGRKKEMIKVSGQIVYAPEVEEALYKNPAVAETAVVGLPHKMRGEMVKAFVVLKAGITISAEELRYFCREHLAHFKIPQEIEFRMSLPKNRTGKIDKEALRRGE